METCKIGIVAFALFLFLLDTMLHHPLTSTISPLTALTTASINYHGRKLVQRTLLILSRDNNYSLFLGRSGGNRFFSPVTGHFVDRARDPSFIAPKRLFFTSIGRRGEDTRVWPWFKQQVRKWRSVWLGRCLLNFLCRIELDFDF